MNKNKTTRFIILGCGHTGTTLISGIFKISGFATLGVPSSTFERPYLNDLNDKIVGRDSNYTISKSIDYFLEKLEARTKGKWCLKDPLMAYTIDKIFPRIADPVKIVFNFRDPRKTVSHLYEETNEYFPDQPKTIIKQLAEQQYLRTNRSILKFLENYNVPYIGVNYERLLNGSLNKKINSFVGKEMNYEFIDPAKSKAEPIDVSENLVNLYQEIKEKAKNSLQEVQGNADKRKDTVLTPIRKKIHFHNYMFKMKLKRKLHYSLFEYNEPTFLRAPFPKFEEFERGSSNLAQNK